MSNLLRKPHKGQSCLHQITPADAGWHYVGFGVHDLASGQLLSDVGTDDEVCLVLLSGSAHFTSGDIDFGLITGRKSVFDRTPPHAVYLPHKTSWSVRAAASAEIAVCRAPGMTKDHGPRLITPDQMPLEQRGTGTNTRFVCNILPETEPADSLLVVEVITPAGNWSSYPPHKHD
ncbi:MAG: 5-deoxy-glucuronate isomerase, partial [Pseudomonadota bacterium]|nr:5-deoxy-glucuronate isomerase [Pseudomonadota bacterium]